MEKFVPDHSEHLNLRVSAALKIKLNEFGVANELTEADVVRYILDAGMQFVAENGGIEKVMAMRKKQLAGPFPPPEDRPGRTGAIHRKKPLPKPKPKVKTVKLKKEK